MAKTQSKPKAKLPEWKGYLQVHLTDEQDAEYDVWARKQTIQLTDLDILINNGFKFGLKWDDYHQGVTATLTANDPKLSWSGWVLTAWSDNVTDAILMLFYKHYIICDEDWEHFTGQVERSGRKRG